MTSVMLKAMIRFVPILLLVILLPCLTSAKRVAPVKVEPAIHEGIRYVVPNESRTGRT